MLICDKLSTADDLNGAHENHMAEEDETMKIIIDADGCPRGVTQSCLKLGKEANIPVYTVASFRHQIKSAHHITVGDASQEADLKVVELCKTGDIVVTQDWGLAAIVLGKGAECIHPSGQLYRNETIDFLLEERALKAHHRRAGGKTKGPAKRTASDDHRFEKELMKLIQHTYTVNDSPSDEREGR